MFSVYMYLNLPKERLAPAEKAGQGEGHLCLQGSAEYHQGSISGIGWRTDKRNPVLRLELLHQSMQTQWVAGGIIIIFFLQF